MDTRTHNMQATAHKWLLTKTWVDGDMFLNAYNEIHMRHTDRLQEWTSFINDEFDRMQNRTLDFIVKWPLWWMRLTEMYGGKN